MPTHPQVPASASPPTGVSRTADAAPVSGTVGLARRWRRSLLGQLLVPLLGLLALIWAGMVALTWHDLRDELDDLLDGHLAQAAALLVTQQTHEIEGVEGELHAAGAITTAPPELNAPTLHRYAPQVAFQVFHEGALILRSSNAPAQAMGHAGRGEKQQGHLDEATGLQTVEIDGQYWRVFTALGAEHDIRVYVGEQIALRDHIALAALRSMFGPMLLALPLLGLALAWSVHRGLGPLRQLGSALAQRGPQDLHGVEIHEPPREMEPLLAALNGLFARIDELMESERRFTADAAHELRTPIAVIRTQAQVALREADDEQRRHALQATLAGCDRATRVVEQLLTLSRLEAGALPPFGPVDLAGQARQTVADLAPTALGKGQQIELALSPEAPAVPATDGHGADAGVAQAAGFQARGNATLLAVLLRNLVDNAIRYSPRGASVQVLIRRTVEAAGGDEVLQVVVSDSGPGLSEADLARLGERFFRVLGSGESGSGLGWSIVRRIARVHGARLTLGRSATLGGLQVVVSLQAAASAPPAAHA